MMGVHHSIFTDAVMANSVPQILYKSCNIQKVVLHKQKNRLASMRVALIQPSSAAAERVFSILASSFDKQQESSLE